MHLRPTTRLLAVAAAAALATALTSCSSITIRSDWDTTVDFTSYSSFVFLDRGDGPRRGSPLVHQRIEHALQTELAAKGFDKVVTPWADLAVTYYVGSRQEVRVVHGGYYGWGGPWRRGYWGPSHVHTYRTGTLVVDIVDRRQQQLVWRGVADGAFGRPDPSDEQVAKVVARLLTEFPPTG